MDSDYFINYLFLIVRKLFEFPIERNFANEKAFNAIQYPSIFQYFYEFVFFYKKCVFFF
jgi:hypothetical protein